MVLNQPARNGVAVSRRNAILVDIGLYGIPLARAKAIFEMLTNFDNGDGSLVPQPGWMGLCVLQGSHLLLCGGSNRPVAVSGLQEPVLLSDSISTYRRGRTSEKPEPGYGKGSFVVARAEK